MVNLFPLVRGGLLGAVAAWTLIVLGIAIHFQMSFVDSAAELTYVSLAVFVAAVTLATFLVILVAPCNRKVSTVLRTKWELLWLGILAILWTALAGYTTSPEAKDTEIECWEEDEDGNIVADNVPGYSESVYQARYRVLQAFSFFNCILLLALFLFILILALWHHTRGRYVIWTTPTTAVGWFDRPTGHGNARRLPLPVTQRKTGKVDKEFGGKAYYEEWDNEKEVGSGHKRGFKFDAPSSARDKIHAVEERLKDKIRPLTLNAHAHRKDQDYENLIQKPVPAAKKESGKDKDAEAAPAAKSKPRQYVVKVPASEAVNKPSLAPIAARMKEQKEREHGSGSGSAPQRQVSQREKADQARQQARRDRNTDDERPGRDVSRQNSGARAKRSGSTPAAGAARASESKPVPPVPAVTRRESSRTRPEGGVKREPSQTRVDVVRTGSGRKPVPGANAGGGGVRREGSGRETRTRQDTTNTNTNRHGSNNPYRNTPRGRI